ncbi:MAG: sigma-70 family RNA polymerase sigma factor [Bacteroidetes bacterium]|nr:sigma-70 family RNA polymerase sigma factor [Bacteroidota bacterium]MCC6655981.1 sigma-70 family RNA polymerase sigma factor [Flavobacteriales bacterium]
MARKQGGITRAVARYGRALFGFIRARVPTDADAEDLLQDVWAQLSLQPEVEAIDQMSGWLYRVARNKIIDRYRKGSTEALDDLVTEDEEGTFSFGELLLAVEDDPDLRLLRDLFWQELEAALAELPENQRLVFVQNELEDKALRVIAEEQGENIKTIISRKRYAVQHLRERLETIYHELTRP